MVRWRPSLKTLRPDQLSDRAAGDTLYQLTWGPPAPSLPAGSASSASASGEVQEVTHSAGDGVVFLLASTRPRPEEGGWYPPAPDFLKKSAQLENAATRSVV